ncbi:MAG: LPS export ABC transporter permease LptF [Gammaproteobacteria bacterium]
MILRRYFTVEILRNFAIIIGSLVLIYFSSRFASYLGQAAEGKIAADDILTLISLKMLVSMKELIPLSLYLGVFATMVRMQRDLELTIMRAAGVSHNLLITSALVVGFVAALLVATITLYAEPRAELEIEEISERTENEATISGVKAGTFKEMSGGKRILYAEDVADDGDFLQNTFVQSRSTNSTGIMRSDNARVETDAITSDRFAVFRDGTSYAGSPGKLDYQITEFKKYGLRIENRSPTDLSRNVNYIATSDVMRFHGPIYSAELQARLGTPIATILLPVLAILIGLTIKGGNWHVGLLTAISVYFVYNNLLGVAKSLVKKGDLSPYVGLWIVHLGLILLLVILLVRQRRPSGIGRRPKQELLRAR